MTQARGRTEGSPARLGVPASPATLAAPVVQGGRILIVEDEPALLRALRINLRARGYDVATAPTGLEALAEAERQPPDAVLRIAFLSAIRPDLGERPASSALPRRVRPRCAPDLGASASGLHRWSLLGGKSLGKRMGHFPAGGLAFRGNVRARDGHEGQQVIESCEVVGVCGE